MISPSSTILATIEIRRNLENLKKRMKDIFTKNAPKHAPRKILY